MIFMMKNKLKISMTMPYSFSDRNGCSVSAPSYKCADGRSQAVAGQFPGKEAAARFWGWAEPEENIHASRHVAGHSDVRRLSDFRTRSPLQMALSGPSLAAELMCLSAMREV